MIGWNHSMKELGCLTTAWGKHLTSGKSQHEETWMAERRILPILHFIEKYDTYTAVNGQIWAIYAPHFIIIQVGVLRPYAMRVRHTYDRIRHKYGVVHRAVLPWPGLRRNTAQFRTISQRKRSHTAKNTAIHSHRPGVGREGKQWFSFVGGAPPLSKWSNHVWYCTMINDWMHLYSISYQIIT